MFSLKKFQCSITIHNFRIDWVVDILFNGRGKEGKNVDEWPLWSLQIRVAMELVLVNCTCEIQGENKRWLIIKGTKW